MVAVSHTRLAVCWRCRFAPAVLQALEDFCRELDTVQNTLARKLNVVEDVRTDKVGGRALVVRRGRAGLTPASPRLPLPTAFGHAGVERAT